MIMASICWASAFASVISVFLVGWFRNLILSGHARDDGTDVRGLVVCGYLIGCLAAPAPMASAAWSDSTPWRRWPRSDWRSRSALFELTQELVRARLMASPS